MSLKSLVSGRVRAPLVAVVAALLVAPALAENRPAGQPAAKAPAQAVPFGKSLKPVRALVAPAAAEPKAVAPRDDREREIWRHHGVG